MQSGNQPQHPLSSSENRPPSGNRALHTLSNTLASNERVLSVVEGAYDDSVGVLVATDLRVLYVGCSPQNESIVENFPYVRINNLTYREEITNDCVTLEITRTDKKLQVAGCTNDKVQQFIRIVQETIEDRRGKSEDLNTLSY